MNLGIYKPGQGYWVRVLTAIFAGSVALAGAMWAWQQAATIAIPTPTRQVTLAGESGEVTEGMTLELLGPSEDADARVAYGTAVVLEAKPSTSTTHSIVVGEVEMTPDEEGQDRYFGQATHVGTPAGEGGARSMMARINDSVGIRAFEPLYLQAGMAGLVMLLSAVLILYFVGVKRQTVDFLIATDGEMKKVNWSTRREIIGSTWVVVASSFIIAMFLFLVNSVFSSLFSALGVLG